MKLKIEGVKDLERKLAQMSKIMTDDVIDKGLKMASEPMRMSASSKAPKRTGFLSQNIVSEINKKEKSTIDIGPSKAAWYGRLLEFGTTKMRARPFLRPAFDAHKRTSQKIFAEYVKSLIEAVK